MCELVPLTLVELTKQHGFHMTTISNLQSTFKLINSPVHKGVHSRNKIIERNLGILDMVFFVFPFSKHD